MDKWRKFLSLALMSLALYASTPSALSADTCDSSCDSCGCNFDVGVDFLWWKPCVGDLNYCAEKDGSNYKQKSICTDWESGFRIYIGKDDCYCGWDFNASYTYLNSSSSSSHKNNNNIVPSNYHPGFLVNQTHDEGKGSYDSCYHEWDLLWSFDNSCDCCQAITHSFGVAGINMDQELKATLVNSSGKLQTKWKSDFWGVGLRLGTDFSKTICDCMSFFAGGNVTLLAGDSCSKSQYDSQGGSTDPDHTFKEDDFCHIVPGYHLRAGFSYDTCYCDWDMSFRLGYEFLAWHNIPFSRTYVAGIGGASDSSVSSLEGAISTACNTRTYGFHGLFAGVQLSF